MRRHLRRLIPNARNMPFRVRSNRSTACYDPEQLTITARQDTYKTDDLVDLWAGRP